MHFPMQMIKGPGPVSEVSTFPRHCLASLPTIHHKTARSGHAEIRYLTDSRISFAMGMLFLQVLVLYLALVAGNALCQQPTGTADADRVVRLPGQPANVGFGLYAGNVNVAPGRDLFYVFAQCSNDTAGTKPLVIWFNGGPGCSSLASGFARENGPFYINPGGAGLAVNEFSWHKEGNMIWLESPTGVGYSYSSQNITENVVGGDTRTAEDAYNFLVGWFGRFPQYRNRDFYITGESYAGHYVPQLAKVIVDRNKVAAALKINIKGYLIGNPDIDYVLDYTGDLDYYHSHAMISTETYTGMKKNCNFADCCTPTCNQLFQTMYAEIGAIDYYNIYGDTCIRPKTTTQANQSRLPNGMMRFRKAGYNPCAEDYAEIYFNRPDVQLALHANASGHIPYKWTMCSTSLPMNWTDAPMSMIPTHQELMAAGLKIWIYSGDADSVVPVTSTRPGIEAMKLPIVTPWHPWFDHQQVGGRAVEYKGLTFVTVRGGPHQVPQLFPGRFLQILQAFLAVQPLPLAPFV